MSGTDVSMQFFDPPPLLRMALDMLEMEVMFIDTDYNILYVNKTKRENFRDYPDLTVGKKCYMVLEGHGERCPYCVAPEAMESGEIVKNSNCVSIREHGEIRHASMTVRPVIDENGKVIGAIEITVDTEELVQSHLQLSVLNKEYESVIYALSHDLRAPLISIRGFLKKLEKYLEVTELDPITHCLERIDVNVDIMNGLVTVLLDKSRIATGNLDLRTIDTAGVVDSTIHQFQHPAEEQGAVLTTTGDFPVIRCDSVRLGQIFSNLVGNALTHCKNTPDLSVEIGYADGIFWVRDNGPGIEESLTGKAFDAFTQGTSSNHHSFGMGMNIVHRIVQKHGGKTWIDTAPGKGTCVYFTLKEQVPTTIDSRS